MKKYITLSIISLLLLTSVSTAQINLRLPKIGIPKKDDVGGSARPSSGQRSNRQLIIDDGFTFFDAEHAAGLQCSRPATGRDRLAFAILLAEFGTVRNAAVLTWVVTKAAY